MKRLAVAGCVVMFSLALTEASQAQGLGSSLKQVMHDCTFTRPCNWSSHALIAFGSTHALHKVGVPRSAAAGAAALFFLGKEVRDHRKWRVLGSADSNGDLLSGCAGALLAWYTLRPDKPAILRGIMIDVRDGPWLTLSLRVP